MSFDDVCTMCGGYGQVEVQPSDTESKFEDCSCRWQAKGSSVYTPKLKPVFICRHCNQPHDRIGQITCAIERVEIDLSKKYNISIEELRAKKFLKKI